MCGNHFSVKSSYESKKIRNDSSLLFLVIESSQVTTSKAHSLSLIQICSIEQTLNIEYIRYLYANTSNHSLKSRTAYRPLLLNQFASILPFASIFWPKSLSNNNANQKQTLIVSYMCTFTAAWTYELRSRHVYVISWDCGEQPCL